MFIVTREESGEEEDSSYEPAVGDFCCAQFSYDACWYRAKVLEVLSVQEASPVKGM